MATGVLTVLTPFLVEGGKAAAQIGGSIGGDRVTGSTPPWFLTNAAGRCRNRPMSRMI